MHGVWVSQSPPIHWFVVGELGGSTVAAGVRVTSGHVADVDALRGALWIAAVKLRCHDDSKSLSSALSHLALNLGHFPPNICPLP